MKFFYLWACLTVFSWSLAFKCYDKYVEVKDKKYLAFAYMLFFWPVSALPFVLMYIE